jgi:hypothetical protein
VHTYRCFGIPVTSSLVFPGAWPADTGAGDPTVLRHGRLGSWAVEPDAGWAGVCDGEPFAVQRSPGGAHRFLRAGEPMLELSADHRQLTGDLAPVRRHTRWWRALLDSVLFTVGLLRGGDALHAGAVRTPAGAVAIAGPSGAGKSTLLAHLLAERGCELVADDVLFLRPGPATVEALPGPPVMTVPGAVRRAPGRLLATLGEERWMAVAVHSGPVPLRRIVALDRSGGDRAQSMTEPDPFTMLMRHLLPFPRTPERASGRLELAAATGASVELLRLRARVGCPVEEVAERVLEGIERG